MIVGYVFFFSSRRRHTRFDCDWSSDVCSSDLFLISRPVTSLKDSADSRTSWISSTVKSWMPSRSLRLRLMVSRQEHHAVRCPRLLQINFNRFFKCCRLSLAHIDSFDPELTVTAIHQHSE